MAETKVVGGRQHYHIYVDRPSKWQSPFSHRKDANKLELIPTKSPEETREKYREWITNGDGVHLLKDIKELVGKKIGCWGYPKASHADVLAELANSL
jgi:hypothetical protein